MDKNFYDMPYWSYTLISKPVSVWKGHAYAVSIDDTKQTMECRGGIEWGYRLPIFSLRPQAIEPRALSKEDWDSDFELFADAIKPWFKKHAFMQRVLPVSR